MKKRKTALQSAISEIELEINKPNHLMPEEIAIAESIIEILKSLLPQEKQDLIDTYLEGAMDSPLNSPNDAKLYFKDTFENEN